MPREKQGGKEKNVIEEIKTRQTADDASSTVPAGDPASTVGARYGAERKPMVSWAALLDEAVKKAGFHPRRLQPLP
jgi:hypothetical protein